MNQTCLDKIAEVQDELAALAGYLRTNPVSSDDAENLLEDLESLQELVSGLKRAAK